MADVLLICGLFDVYGKGGHKTGRQEFVVSHGVDLDTDKTVILPCVHPSELGATHLGGNDWILYDKLKKGSHHD